MLAWLSWAVLNVGNGLGDTLPTRGWRRRNPTAPGNAWWQAAKEATFTTKRPLPLTHGFLAGGTCFTALAAAVVSSWYGWSCRRSGRPASSSRSSPTR